MPVRSRSSSAVRKAFTNLAALAKGRDLVTRLRSEEKSRLLAQRRAEVVIREVLERHYGGVHLPPSALRQHVGTDDSVLGFWSKGINSSRLVLRVFGPAPAGPVLDWGCGSGRTRTWLRHLEGWQTGYRGCDIDADAIDWLRSIGETGVQVCATEPPLPYADASLAGVFAFSVLTHLRAQTHRCWYTELHRVLQPGATACLTTMGAPMAASIGRGLPDELARHGFAWLDVEGYYRDAAIVSEAFTRDALESLFDVTSFEEGGYGGQDLWILTRR